MRLAHSLAQSLQITGEINTIVTILQKRFGHSENLTDFPRFTHQESNKADLNQAMLDKMYNYVAFAETISSNQNRVKLLYIYISALILAAQFNLKAKSLNDLEQSLLCEYQIQIEFLLLAFQNVLSLYRFLGCQSLYKSYFLPGDTCHPVTFSSLSCSELLSYVQVTGL